MSGRAVCLTQILADVSSEAARTEPCHVDSEIPMEILRSQTKARL